MSDLLSASSVLGLFAIVLSFFAIYVTVRLSRKAEESLRKSTKVAAFATGHVLQAFQDAQRPDDVETIRTNAPVWSMTATPCVIEPGGTVELRVEQMASGDSPLDKDKITSLRLVVDLPSRRRSYTKRPEPQLLDGFTCEWRAQYPAAFDGAGSDEEGIYTVYCSVPDDNYKMLLASFFVLQ